MKRNRHLLHLLSLCSAHLTSHPSHLSSLLSALRPQLEELPDDLQQDELNRHSLWVEVVERLDDMAEDVRTQGGGAGEVTEGGKEYRTEEEVRVAPPTSIPTFDRRPPQRESVD